MSLVIRIIAPTGRDAELASMLLRRNGIAAEACKDIVRLLNKADHPLGPLLIAEEAMDMRTRAALVEAIRRQPAWSDLPILILTGTNRTVPKGSVDRFSDLGFPIMLERPLRPETLISSIRAALRARQRQYEIRDALKERDNAMASLKSEQETLRVVVDNLPVGVIVTGPEGHLLIANRKAEQMFGAPLSGAANAPCWILWKILHPDGQPLKNCEYPLWRAIHTGEPIPPDDYLYRGSENEMRWIRIAAAPIVDPQGTVSGGVAALSDIDREKRAEAALIKSEKLAAVGRLAASISHEINNPLEAVTNLLYLVEKSSPDTNASLFAARAQDELARVSQIVTQTLRFHRQSSNPQLIAVRDLLESVLALYRSRVANQNITVGFQYRVDAKILCREGDVRQVLNNLIGNAIDAMRAGGRLMVKTNTARDIKTNVAGIRVSIADTGHGIPPEAMKHIFEPFYTTKGDSGSGLGLWISQEIIGRNNGRLRIRSKAAAVGGGTVATIFLPYQIDRP